MTTAGRLLVTLLALLVSGPLEAGRGVAELALDRAAVTELLAAAVPESLSISVPGAGEVRIGVGAPIRVDFRDGGVEATFPLRVDGIGWDAPLWVRYLPEVEPKYGAVRLVPVAAELPSPFNAVYDPIRWMPAVDLPRQLEWEVDLPTGGRLQVHCYLQGVKIDEERLVVQLGLQLSGRSEPKPAPSADRRQDDQVVPSG